MRLKITHKYIDGVEHKRCGRCKEWKILTHFNKDKNSRDKLRCNCKLCLVAERKKRKQYITEYNEKYWKNRDVEEEKRKKRKWRDDNRECLPEKNRKYYLQNLEHRKKSDRAYRKANWERIKQRNREWRKRTQYEKKKRKNDIHYRLKSNISRRLREILKQGKSKSTMKYVGCNIETLKCHLESKFAKFMSWRQAHMFHIDHCIPCAAFNMENELDKRVCWWYKNLQPLWVKDNLAKKDKYKEEDKQALIKEWIFYHI